MKFMAEEGKIHSILLNENDTNKIACMFKSENYGYDWREVVGSYIKKETGKHIDLTDVWIYYEDENNKY